MEDNKNKNKKKLNLFNIMNRDGKGVEKDSVLNVLEKPNIANFFKLLGRKINQLLSINMFFIFGNFPVLFALFAFAGYTSHTVFAPGSGLFTALKGSMYFNMSPVTATLNGIYGIQAEMTVPTVFTYVFYGLALLVFVTFGLVNVGTTYILRNIVRGEPIFMWSDFWYAIKRNIKQGIIFGIIDLFISLMLVYDLFFFKSNMGSNTMLMIFYFLSFGMIFIYFFMRMYTYLMMITFDLSIFKLLKNSVFFAILGIKRNIMCLIGIALTLLVNFLIYSWLPPIGIILPFVFTIALCAFISVYCAYPKIKEIMIDPYYKEVKTESEE